MVAEIVAAELSNYEVDIEPITYAKGKKPKFKGEREKIGKGDLSSFEFSERIFDLSPYELVCIGTPTWGGLPAYIIMGYIEKCNTFEGKAIVLFNTCRFYIGRTIKDMKTAIEEKGGRVIKEKSFKKFFRMKEKDPRAFGKELNQYRP